MPDPDNYTDLQQPAQGNYVPLQSGSGSSQGSGSAPAKATGKTYTLPDAETNWSSNLARYPAVSSLPLYEKAAPNFNQVKQQVIANCYLAATIACMANTKIGREVIKKMIKETKSAITTICKKFDFNVPPGPEMQIKSNRWFTVSFKSQAVDVSDVLYHDDSDSDPSLIYLTTPGTDKAIWGSIIEVAYARYKGGYDNIGSGTVTLDVFYGEFCSLDWELLYPGKDDAEIKTALANAGKQPALVATKVDAKKLTKWHGLAVLAMSGNTVKLWDPLKAKTETIAFSDLLGEIQAAVVAK